MMAKWSILEDEVKKMSENEEEIEKPTKNIRHY